MKKLFIAIVLLLSLISCVISATNSVAIAKLKAPLPARQYRKVTPPTNQPPVVVIAKAASGEHKVFSVPFTTAKTGIVDKLAHSNMLAFGFGATPTNDFECVFAFTDRSEIRFNRRDFTTAILTNLDWDVGNDAKMKFEDGSSLTIEFPGRKRLAHAEKTGHMKTR